MTIKVYVIFDPHTACYFGRLPKTGVGWVREPKQFMMFADRALAEQKANRLAKPWKPLRVVEAAYDDSAESPECLVPARGA